ncbi:MAG: trypsin-like peptidase domain-containing protein [Hyphomicrobiaceae bacterium]|nr:trypsin-like peptidase domain-containing protein [Hyphomicrobiaceae bacterium]
MRTSLLLAAGLGIGLALSAVAPARAVIVGDDDRKTFEDYASDKGFDASSLQKRFAASGWLLCFSRKKGGDVGVAAATAQLVGRPDVIATASHTFLDTRTGRVDVNFSQCGFLIWSQGRIVARKIVASSVTIPGERATLASRRFGNDWAVMRLDEPVPGVRPYDLVPASDIARLREGAELKVTTVIGFHDNWSGGKSTLSISDCDVAVAPAPPKQMRFTTTGTRALLTNCDIGRGASGAALLVDRGGKPAMLGMTIISVGSDLESVGKSLDFSSSRPHFNIAISAEGRFGDAIRRLSGGRAAPSPAEKIGGAATDSGVKRSIDQYLLDRNDSRN